MIAPAALPGRPPPRPTGIAPFLPPVLPEDAAARYQARCEALGPSDEAPIPDALPVHPSANDYPMLPLAELRALAADIAEKGLQRKIVLHNGAVVDGRNRFAACLLGGILPQFEAWAGRGGSIDAFIESENDRRRHSPPTVRAAVAAFRANVLHKLTYMVGKDSALTPTPVTWMETFTACDPIPGSTNGTCDPNAERCFPIAHGPARSWRRRASRPGGAGQDGHKRSADPDRGAMDRRWRRPGVPDRRGHAAVRADHRGRGRCRCGSAVLPPSAGQVHGGVADFRSAARPGQAGGGRASVIGTE